MHLKTVIPPAEHPAFPSFVQWSEGNEFLSVPECEWLIARGESQRLVFASVGTPTVNRVEQSTRCVESGNLTSEDMGWLYERIANRVAWANRDYYGFDLTTIEAIQFLKYTPAAEDKPDGHYTWHVDFGEGAMCSRKLSLIVQLSPPHAYDGCGLTLCGDRGHSEPGILGQGHGIVFPSWTPHMVSPITRGIRYAIVAWIHGPRFR